MFKFKNISDSEVRKIFAIKKQGFDNSERNFSKAGGEKSDLVMPHDTFVIGLSSLRENEFPMPQLSGMRVIEANQDSFKLIYDLHNSKDRQNDEPQLLRDPAYIKAYEKAFDTIFGSEMESENYVVRSLKIPALYVDAIWLHKNNQDKDLYIPVRSMNIFEDNKVYDKNSFYKILKKVAVNYDINDEKLGG